jgi:hypothetical protein
MRLIPLALVTLVFATACDQLQVTPEVIGARISVDRAKPDAEADIVVDVELDGATFTNDRVILERVGLERRRGNGSAAISDLDLGFPSDFNPWLGGEQKIAAGLVNLGTVNAQLIPLCGESLDLTVYVSRDGDRSVSTASNPYALVVNCP